MDIDQFKEAKGVLAEKRTALESTRQFISNHAIRLAQERWCVPRHLSEAVIQLNLFGSTVEAAYVIAQRWSEVEWKRVDISGLSQWEGATEGVVLVISYVCGDQPVANGEVVDLFPNQVKRKAGI